MKRRRSYQFSSADDERWTLLTWGVFLGVTGIFFAGFWRLAGPGWLGFVKTAFGATVGLLDEGILFVVAIGSVAFVLPFIVAMIPALVVMLGISQFIYGPANDEEIDHESDESSQSGSDCGPPAQ